ncbi:MAG: HEAT repeat domain-containing protein [Thermoguttaceae bacterium]
MNPFQEKTLQFLVQSEDPAALELLRPLLYSDDWGVRRFAFEGMYLSGDPAIHIEFFREFVRDPKGWREHCPPLTDDRLGKVVMNALRSEDMSLVREAAVIAADFRLYDALGAYVPMIEGLDLKQAEFAAKQILRLGELFYEDLVNAPPAERANLDRKRAWFSAELDAPVKHYAVHKMDEPLRALLMVTKKEFETFQNVTRDIHSDACKRLMEILDNDQNPGFFRLLLSFILDSEAPPAMDALIVKKTEPRFVRNLLLTVGTKIGDTEKKALKRFRDFAWMSLPPDQLLAVIGDQEIPFVMLLTAMTLPREKLVEMFSFVLKNLGVEGRRVAVDLLKQYPGDDFNNLLLSCIEDSDPQVVSSILRILRGRNFQGCDALLLKCVERNDPVINATVYDLAPEYRIEGLIQRMSQLTESGARELGAVVGRVDTNTRRVVETELGSYIGVRRQVALDCIRYLGYGKDYETKVISLAETDTETSVRVAAFRVLAEVLTKDAVMTIKQAMSDKSLAIREAATEALRNWMARYNAAQVKAAQQ